MDSLKDLALEIAKNSEMNNKHGCLIIKNGSIISTGFNKYLAPKGSPPSQTFSSKKNHTKGRSIHAEVDAINNCCRKDLNGAILLVARLDKNTGGCMNSEPCSNCKRVINKFNFSKIYYTR